MKKKTLRNRVKELEQDRYKLTLRVESLERDHVVLYTEVHELLKYMGLEVEYVPSRREVRKIKEAI